MKWILTGDFRDDIEAGNLAVDGDSHDGEGFAQFDQEGTHGGMSVDFRVSGGNVTIWRIEIEDDDITVQTLQDLSVSEIKRAILDRLDLDLPIRRREVAPSRSNLDWRKEWPSGDNLRSFLYIVTHVYNKAVAREMPATLQVAKTFQVSRATAARMVAKAREEGFKVSSPAPYPGKRKEKTSGPEGTETGGTREDHN